ncbi:acyl-CoA dehydrogenase [Runella slithyformis]|uniref:Butyryl-CoA dehydrogenase n=1 Tax=Runella slithyformis (strain ATCC 29530 / DSM 19594 / LMG 11500 / NCIMB 11436 / LSU 4) TaxID=761193 RepID=A0A7U4E5J0_RUNSL|nr:acyl-CoA dehydrogenase [Runella slithyformis]AEI48179.1 Butyryl-CoA dehydrogenase [Runella slithyformis DSM 19594]
MAQYYSRRNLNFLLYEVFNATELTHYPYYSAHDRETFDMTIDAVTQIGDTLMFPHFRDLDRNQPELKNGKVTVHPKVGEYLKAMGDAGLIGTGFSFEDGGQQLPEIVNSVLGFILMAANNGMMYTGLTSGAARLIATFASEELKQTYVEKMLGGKWQGTMALTEPQAGSSLSDITTSATPQADGSYRIKGQKVFISAGDHDQCENIIHLMLARIDGAPKGTKGISLFVVPKYRLDGADNDVTSTGIYHKLGQRGVPAMHLTMGDNDDCHGWLVGEPHRGLNYMFQMMNEARIGVGMTGAAIASAAYEASLQYAKERPQSRRLNQKTALDSPQIPIIQHPDVKRMLLLQKAVVEGSLSLLMETARCADIAHASEDPEEKEKYHLMLELLTPVAKTYPTEMGMVAVSNGLQVLGGYGFTEDFPLEQLYRDIRITPIYEGTTGIQSQDLLGRKMTMKGGKPVQFLFGEVAKTIAEAETHENLKPYAQKLKAELGRLQEVTMALMPFAMQGDIERFLMDATLYMEMFGINTIAWQWLKQAVVAQRTIVTQNPDGEELAFYEGKIHTMKFFFHYEVPKTLGLAVRLKDNEVLTIATEKEVVL